MAANLQVVAESDGNTIKIRYTNQEVDGELTDLGFLGDAQETWNIDGNLFRVYSVTDVVTLKELVNAYLMSVGINIFFVDYELIYN